ncbi:MAG: hypothetical protein ACTSPB_10350 [Candidatus Thorarchaeota archaeon]
MNKETMTADELFDQEEIQSIITKLAILRFVTRGLFLEIMDENKEDFDAYVEEVCSIARTETNLVLKKIAETMPQDKDATFAFLLQYSTIENLLNVLLYNIVDLGFLQFKRETFKEQLRQILEIENANKPRSDKEMPYIW